MNIIELRLDDQDENIINQLQKYLGGTLSENDYETALNFNTTFGKGTIRLLSFEWGVSLTDYDVTFIDDTKLLYRTSKETIIEFLFISEGVLKYGNGKTSSEPVVLERYQNIIISNLPNSENTFVFPKNTRVKVNIIKMLTNAYKGKKHNNIGSLPTTLLSIFNGDESELPYRHSGNYNLKIASIINKLKNSKESGIIRSLSIEGQLNLILALQLLEFENYENKMMLPNSLTHRDVKKIKNIVDFIDTNIGDPITIDYLSLQFGVSPKKIQLGFKLLYNETVNQYIRNKKLERAHHLLKTTDDTISEIVYKIGYKSRSYFSKIFFKQYGILPHEFKAKLLESSNL